MKDKMKTRWKKLKDIHPDLRPVTSPYKKGLCKLEKSFFLTCRFKGRVYEMDIGSGFIFDGASIPRFAWSTTGSPFLPEYIGPALIHDYMYRFHVDSVRSVTRKEADLLFKHLLTLNSVSGYQANKMYWSVRGFGKFSW